MTDLSTMTIDELNAKQRWYEARGTRFLDQIAAIRAELEARRLAAQPRPSKGSVVNPVYKARYGKARGCGDWLHQFLACRTLDQDQKLIVPEFDALLVANGVDPHGWNRTTPGWQGRLRMSGRACLVSVIKRDGGIRLADGSQVTAPTEYVASLAKPKPANPAS
jgi:hypothetical protein